MTDTTARPWPHRLDGTPIEHVLVALDGSHYAERSLVAATHIAERLGLPIGLVKIIDKLEDSEAAKIYLEKVSSNHHGVSWHEVTIDADPATALLTLTEQRRGLLCVASHGHTRLGDAVIGSTASELTRHSTEPVLFIGSGYDTALRHYLRRIVVPLDGTTESEAVVPWAGEWAAAAGMVLHLVTVAELVSRPLTSDEQPRRRFGPSEAPEEYIAAAVNRHQRPGVDVVGLVLYDPISPASALSQWLRHAPDAIVFIATEAEAGTKRIRHGSTAAALIQQSPTPLMIAPDSAFI